jgi:hypothetical protein
MWSGRNGSRIWRQLFKLVAAAWAIQAGPRITRLLNLDWAYASSLIRLSSGHYLMAPRRKCNVCGSQQWHKEPATGLVVCSEGHVLQVCALSGTQPTGTINALEL